MENITEEIAEINIGKKEADWLSSPLSHEYKKVRFEKFQALLGDLFEKSDQQELKKLQELKEFAQQTFGPESKNITFREIFSNKDSARNFSELIRMVEEWQGYPL